MNSCYYDSIYEPEDLGDGDGDVDGDVTLGEVSGDVMGDVIGKLIGECGGEDALERFRLAERRTVSETVMNLEGNDVGGDSDDDCPDSGRPDVYQCPVSARLSSRQGEDPQPRPTSTTAGSHTSECVA